MYFCNMDRKEWFASWFDTEYYHILYKQRDLKEAECFVGNLCHKLALAPHSRILDLACGKGRHSIILNQMGFDVLGVDLSEQSILKASKFKTKDLDFKIHDMRFPIEGVQFEAVFNLFTSFGYFDSSLDNAKVLQSVHQMLVPGGFFVIDFMNSKKVIRTMDSEAIKEEEGITFQIKKRFDGTHIIKDIVFEDDGNQFHYTERVQAITKAQFEELFANNGFEILCTFGDFDLNDFKEETSDRMILFVKKR